MSVETQNYDNILKSSALIGMSTALTVFIGVIRTKVMAIILGPAGFGLMGLYLSFVDLAVSIAGMGVGNSGVRQIAEAVSAERDEQIARTISVLRRLAVVLGIFGAALLASASTQASMVTFGDARHAGGVTILSFAVFFRIVASGQGALLQGMRRVADLAKISVYGAFLGTLVSIPLVFNLGEQGIAPSIVCISAIAAATSWWYSRQVRIASPAMTASETWRESAYLLKLGFAFMSSGFIMMGAAYLVRLIIVRDIGLDAAGLYSSAWTLGGLYVGYVLQAMGTDFYPQLVGVASDNERCNRLVNDQAYVSLLLAGPGVVATITFAPLVIAMFYSASFFGAVETLRWICFGMALRVISWPTGFILVAKYRQFLFLGSDLAWALVNIFLTWIGVRYFGLAGAGVAFFGSYVLHAALTFAIARSLSGFRWSTRNQITGLIFLASIGIVIGGTYLLPPLWSGALGVIATLASAFHSSRALLNIVSKDHVPKSVMKLLVLLRLTTQD